MSLPLSSLAGAGLFFLLIFLSGWRLSRCGRPLNALVLAAHKFISLGALVFLFILFRGRAADFSALELAAVAAAGLFFISAIVSGGLVSVNRPIPAAVRLLHRITPFLTLFSTALVFYLFSAR